MAGRHKVPLSVIIGGGKTHLTKVQIQERAEAEARFQPGTDKIRCPKELEGAAKKEWRRIVPELLAVGLLTNIDLTALALYCDAYAKYWEASNLVKQEGVVIEYTNAAGATNQIKHPGIEVMAKMAAMIKSFGAEFGLSPGARLRLTVPKKEQPEETPLEKNGFGDV